MNTEVTLHSGSKLVITLAPFVEARALYQAVLEEFKVMKLDPTAEVDVNLFKDLFCVGLSSKKIETALNACLKRVTYNGTKIGEDTWEPIEARDDYFMTLFEVAKANIAPFVKSLSAEFSLIQGVLKSVPALRPETTNS